MKGDISPVEEVRHAHVTTYVLYREIISWCYQRKMRADQTLFLCLIQRCNQPIQPQWFNFNMHSLLEEPSHDK